MIITTIPHAYTALSPTGITTTPYINPNPSSHSSCNHMYSCLRPCTCNKYYGHNFSRTCQHNSQLSGARWMEELENYAARSSDENFCMRVTCILPAYYLFANQTL